MHMDREALEQESCGGTAEIALCLLRMERKRGGG